MRHFASIALAVLALNAGANDGRFEETSPPSDSAGRDAPAARPQPLAWNLRSGTRIEDGVLVAEIEPGATGRKDARASAAIDVSGALADLRSVVVSVRVRAGNVTEPDRPWNGVKVQLCYVDLDGKEEYPAFELPRGSFDWTNATVRLSALANPLGIGGDGRATLLLGLEGCTGRAEFDLTSLRIETEDPGIPRANQDWVVRYPENEQTDLLTPNGVRGNASLVSGEQIRVSPPLRGCMLPARATTEDDIETLHGWGATLVRFQIVRDWLADDADRDLEEYARWIDARLDNLDAVLEWCATRGMKVCVDLHSPPGGRRRGDRELGMMRDDRHADAFVETWRRIAARFKGHPALYGYDLVNEPKQLRPVRNDYWTLQRRAAEAIRGIDPKTPIIVESNVGASPASFAYLSPLAMDNVIYELHLYAPGDYTHQGVGRPLAKDGKPQVWPDPVRGWDGDCLRRVLEPVREFQEKHECRIYVGEFSAAAWAPGAENYLRDCIALFGEYGWDWTYHAFREWSAWSVEHEVSGPGKPPVPSADNPRKRALLEGLR